MKFRGFFLIGKREEILPMLLKLHFRSKVSADALHLGLKIRGAGRHFQSSTGGLEVEAINFKESAKKLQ